MLQETIPSDPDEDPWVEEMAHKISLLSPALRSVTERLVNSLVEGEEQEQEQSKSQTKDKIIHAVDEVK